MLTTLLKNKLWILYAILGALVYGIFSFGLEYISPEIKKEPLAVVVYGILVSLTTGCFVFIFFIIWSLLYPTLYKTLIKEMNYKLILLTTIVAGLITPIHSLTINTGGSLGQQIMYTCAIIPILIGSYIYSNERLNKYQIFGIILAILGTFLMSHKKKEKNKKIKQ